PSAPRGGDGAPSSPSGARGRALHSACRTEDPGALGAVPRGLRRRGRLAELLRKLVVLLPLRPGAGVEAAVAAGEMEAVERDARGDARAAIGDELAGG